MPPDPLLLLPPSEGKEPGAHPGRRLDAFAHQIAPERALVLDALKAELEEMTTTRAERLFRAHGALLDRALESTRAIVDGDAPTMPAWRRYTGVVWEHLDPASLGEAQRKRLLVPSGLYGLTRGTDAVVDYRLSMLVSVEGIGRLAGFWRNPVTRALCSVANGAQVIDLLPKEHAAAIDHAALGEVADIVRVRFVTHDGERAAGHGAKAAKGIVARRLLDAGLDRISTFRWEGWRISRVGGDLEVVAPAPS